MSLDLQPELTPRQQQILQLLQAGKVNKEVARELDIGLGTVKQHIVAIFKKLKVKNRTAAVSRHLDMAPPSVAASSQMQAGVLLTRRPCVVLSMALSTSVGQELLAAFYGVMASAAASQEAIFLTRQGNAGEIIFGVQRVTEYDVAVAIQTAHRVAQSLIQIQPWCAQHVKGCLSAGLALASMHRFGGWTGEAIASAAIASARELLESTRDGFFTCDQATLDLCSAFGVAGFAGMREGVRFEQLAILQWHGVRRSFPLVGRKTEVARLRDALQTSFASKTLILIEGEMGMGKTRLCQELLQACQDQRVLVRHFRGLPQIMNAGICDVGRGTNGGIESVIEALQDESSGSAHVILLDDFHLLAQELQLALMQLATQPSPHTRLIVFSGRKGLSQMAKKDTPCILLRRLALRDSQRLVSETLAIPRGKQRTKIANIILDTASGVPLFAVEMAQNPNESDLSLSLRVAISARIDKLHLDFTLLAFVARQPAEVSFSEIVAGLHEDTGTLQKQVERAIASGVLARSSAEKLTFTHPMIRHAINNLTLEQPIAA